MSKTLIPLYSLWALLLLLAACTKGSAPVEDDIQHGWRSAGLEPDPEEIRQWGTGISALAAVDRFIFARDAKVANPSNTFIKDHQMFYKELGAPRWDTLRLPNGHSPYAILGLGKYFYVGTDRSGQVWRFDPYTATWTNLRAPIDSGWRVSGLGSFRGNLVTGSSNGERVRVHILNRDSLWVQLGDTDIEDRQFNFHTAVEFRNKLFVATWDRGVAYWDPGDSSWTTLPPVHEPFIPLDHVFPRSMVVHRDSLFVGYWNAGGIHTLNEQNQWVQVDSIFWAREGGRISNAPAEVYAMVSNGEHLIAAGKRVACPVVYTGPAEPKGWRMLSWKSFCPGFSCLSDRIYSLAIAGDTLFAAGWDRVIQYPINRIPEGIQDAKPYEDPADYGELYDRPWRETLEQ